MLDSIRHKLAGWLSPISRSLQDGTGFSAYNGSIASPTLAGPAINSRTALSIAAVWSAVGCYANTIGSLPLYVAERDERGGRRPAREHWGFDLLNLRPNRRSTSMRLRQAWVGHACTHGNGYLEIEWDARGREARALHLMDPRDIDPVECDGTVVYRQKCGGPDLPAEDVIHLAMFGWDGVKGYSPVSFHAETLGISAAQRTYQAALFGNGANAQGHLEIPGKLNGIQRQQERDSWNKMHQGAQNAGVVGILTEGAKWVQTNFSPQDAELILGCHFSVEETARIWNLPGYKLGLPAPAGLSDEEQENAFLRDSALPWLTAIEQELDLKLLGRIERAKYFTFHDTLSRGRGNLAAQTAADNADIEHGRASINEVRIRRGVEPIDHPFADYHWISTNNLTPLEEMGKAIAAPTTEPAVSTPKPAEPVQPPSLDGLDGALRGILLQEVGRMVRRECNALRKVAKAPRIDLWADGFYPRHEQVFAEAIGPTCRALGVMLGGTVGADNLAGEWAYGSRKALRDLYTTIPPEDMPAAVEKLCLEWESARIEQFVDYVAGKDEAR